MNVVIARAPFAWPLLRGTMRRLFDRLAPSWEARSSAEHLTPLAAALLHVRPSPERALDLGTGLGDAALLIAREDRKSVV